MSSTPLLLPLFDSSDLPPFAHIEADQVVPGIRTALAQAELRLATYEQSVEPTWAGLIDEPTRIFADLTWAWRTAHHLQSVSNSDALRQGISEVQPEVVAFFNKVGQSKPIYAAAKALSLQKEQLSPEQQRVLGKAIHEMELSGIALEGESLETFNKNSCRLAELSMGFSNTLLDSTREFRLVLTELAEVAGLPQTLLGLAAQGAAKNGSPDATAETGPWHITLEQPSCMPFLQHAERRDLRETVYRARSVRASQGEANNQPRIDEILKLRAAQAALLGYAHHAEISLSSRMAKDVAEVRSLMENVLQRTKPEGDKQLQALRQFAAKNGGPAEGEFMNWDSAFWSRKLRMAELDYDSEALRPYLPLPKVLDGLFALAHKLFGIRVEAADGEAQVWNSDVRFFKVFDGDGEQLARFYFDPYSRPENKRGGAWVSGAISRSVVLAPSGEKVRRPAPYMVCNFSAPIGDQPALLSFNEVTTLFHEFGHALHGMLTEVDYDAAAGTFGVERDAVELPSQFMENWCYHKETLLGFSGHWQSGEPLPLELFEKLTRARTYNTAAGTLMQLSFGEVDLALHSDYNPDKDGSVLEVQHKVDARMLSMPRLPEERFLCSFSHIFAGGYSAGYYGYLWAEVLSADAFGAFEEVGLENDEAVRALGRKFRKEVLATGGSRPPAQIFEAFRGRPVEVDALLRHRGLA
jgi:oligopeptidase A